ncbi:coadhesin-like isoform X2 [Orbicella faveolata]|uniref:coadhesin-like isoform X2 n=1 Tax=Orbicella faveolata TaxID=48498 RepID=UPI0009E30FC0|nr:coadhesin-like isoform X2 [Orbicella faveolata]
MPRNVLQTLTIVALVSATFFVAHNFVRYIFRVDGGFSQWTEFSECTRSCGTGTRFRTRTCDNPAPRLGGHDCTVHGEDSQTFKCNMNPCPVNGGYGPWGKFGECTVTCGGGVRQKERPCNNPEPKYLGKTCEEQELGPSIETEACNGDPCPVNGGYGPWGEFGECTVTCGGGVRQRERQCNKPEPKYSGKTCEEQELGPSIQTESCNEEQPCSVDGGYTEWSEFSECTVTCGGGVRERTRECTNPAPENNGKNCEELGPAKESEICNTEACPNTLPQDQGKDSKEDGNKEQANKEKEKREEKEKGNEEEDGNESEKNEKKRGNN